MVTSPSAFSSTLSVEAQISIARAEAASANENDFSSGSHDDDDVDDDDNTDSSDEGDDNIDDSESHLQEFDVVVSYFKERVRAKWNEPEFQRGFKSFKKNFKKTLENDNTLMFQFARENSQNMNVGRKRKHGCQMSDQSINCYGKADTSSCG